MGSCLKCKGCTLKIISIHFAYSSFDGRIFIDMRPSLLRETIRRILFEYEFDEKEFIDYTQNRQNSALYKKEKEEERQRMAKKPQQQSSISPEKTKLFQDIVKYMKKYMEIDKIRERSILKKVIEMDRQAEYFVKSYLSLGGEGYEEIKNLVLPGLQEQDLVV